jgi:hemerythrin
MAPAEPEMDERFAWRPEYELGDAEIDAQHQELFRRAGRFIGSLKRPSRQETGILLSYLRLYCVAHFGAEEAWMREAGYLGAAEHARQHNGFMKDLIRLSEQHERQGGGGIEPERVSGWLEKWLRTHVTGTDQELARLLLTTGRPLPKAAPAEPGPDGVP